MVKVRMRQTVLLGPERQRLERGKEYEVAPDQAELLVPRHATYVDGPPAEETVDDTDLTKLTVSQLKELAAELGVELTATKKADIIAEIEAVSSGDEDDDGE